MKGYQTYQHDNLMIIGEIALMQGQRFQSEFGLWELTNKTGQCKIIKGQCDRKRVYQYMVDGFPFTDTLGIQNNTEFEFRGQTYLTSGTVEHNGQEYIKCERSSMPF